MEIQTLKAEISCKEFIDGFVDIPRFDACCAKCPGYGKTWACPPYAFDPMDIWAGYGTLLLYGKKAIVPQSEVETERDPHELYLAYERLLRPVEHALLEELYGLEKEYPGSLALSAGGCDICEECTRGAALPCRFADRMRYSVESLGGNVLKCITDIFKEEVLWAENGRLPGHYILLGGLLK